MNRYFQILLRYCFPALAVEQPDNDIITEQHLLDDNDDLQAQLRKANTFVEQNPNNGRAYAIRSMILRNLNRIKDQLDDLESAIPLLVDNETDFPMLLECLHSRGLGYQSIGNDEQAIDDFTWIMKLDDSHLEVLQSRAFSLCRLAKFEFALNDIDRAIAATPNDAEAIQLRNLIQECNATNSVPEWAFQNVVEQLKMDRSGDHT